MKKRILLLFLVSALFIIHVNAIDPDSTTYVSEQYTTGAFILSNGGQSAPLYYSSGDYPGVIRAVNNLKTDISGVTQASPALSVDVIPAVSQVVIIGTLGKCPIIDALVKNSKLDVSGIEGKWETFIIQTVDNPFSEVDQALVIAGSDKRGTIFGIYDLSAHIGVSPWYWWADVPLKHKGSVYILPGRYSQGEPAVRYRGFFINDEAPSLLGWANQKYGTLNHNFYEKVFELLLRLKANFLWPAMWDNAFGTDDPQNQSLADEYGIVMGTSHEEPMMRAENEWTSGDWDYNTNKEALQDFWRQGIQRMGSFESLVTVGMRGRGDTPMKGSKELLGTIITDQRQIINDVTGKDPSNVKQVWALYNEILDYYDQGLRVPDDVTMLYSDDNWGNLRRLPTPAEAAARPGGYGMYYHFDYVGSPRSYKWVNTNHISWVWEQMRLAYDHGVNRIWIVNVGDIKPMEFPIEFFMDFAWHPKRWTADRLPEYTRRWVNEQFDTLHNNEIASIINLYTKYNSRQKPEESHWSYSLINFRESETFVKDYNDLAESARKIYEALPDKYKDAYYQLILYPVQACANLCDLHYTVAKNEFYCRQGRAATNNLSDRVQYLFDRDAEYSYYYNKIMSGGKWNHMMDQTHISYTSWQQPDKDVVPETYRIFLPAASEMGVSIEGSDSYLPLDEMRTTLPTFDPFFRQTYYIDIFNRGTTPFNYTVTTSDSWIYVSQNQGYIEKEQRLWVSIDWTKAPAGPQEGTITIKGPNNRQINVYVVITNPSSPKPSDIDGFIENGRHYVAIEAEHYSNAKNSSAISWQCIPDFGNTRSGMTMFPDTSASVTPGGSNPCLEYNIYFLESGEFTVQAYVSPMINFYNNSAGLRYGISFDNDQPRTITYFTSYSSYMNAIVSSSTHTISHPGLHTLKFWMADPGVVLQKLVVSPCDGCVPISFLGPPEKPYKIINTVYILNAAVKNGKTIEVTFSKEMKDPAPELGNFILSVDGQLKTIKSINLKASNISTILMAVDNIDFGQKVTLSYTPGSYTSTDDIPLEEINNFPVFNSIITDVPSITSLSGIKLFPNPFSDVLKLENLKGVESVTIFNLSGNKVMEFNKLDVENLDINTSGLNRGLFIIELKNKSTITIIKAAKI